MCRTEISEKQKRLELSANGQLTSPSSRPDCSLELSLIFRSGTRIITRIFWRKEPYLEWDFQLYVEPELEPKVS
jgi:hypothetical protein